MAYYYTFPMQFDRRSYAYSQLKHTKLLAIFRSLLYSSFQGRHVRTFLPMTERVFDADGGYY